jgi:hypothetical protein
MKRKNKIVVLVFTLFTAFVVFSAFVAENPFFTISEKDVVLKIPKRFPKPKYNFENNQLDAHIFSLGRKLFYDNILSKDYSVNCGTCHQRFAAFAHIDHRLSHGIYAKIGTRNVPALQNLIWKDELMWDGGVNNLEVQPLHPITSPIEMDETIVNVILKLKRDSTYVRLFHRAYHDSLINSERLLKALAQFGKHMGIAFQFIDDVLDLSGNPEEIGKNLGDDLAEGKPTLPLLYTMKKGNDQQKNIIRAAIENGGLTELESVLNAVKETKALEYVRQLAKEEIEKGEKLIKHITSSVYKDALLALTQFVILRDY